MNWGSRKEKRFLGLQTQQKKKKKGFQGCGDFDALSPAVVEMVKSNYELRNGVCSKRVCVHSVLGPHEFSVLEHKLFPVGNVQDCTFPVLPCSCTVIFLYSLLLLVTT